MSTGINPLIIVALGIIGSAASFGVGGFLIVRKKKNIGWFF